MGVCPCCCSIPSDSDRRGFGPTHTCVEDHNNPISGRRCLSQPVHGPALGFPVPHCFLPVCGTFLMCHSTTLVCSTTHPGQGRLLHSGSWGFPFATRHLAAPRAVEESGESQEISVIKACDSSCMAGNCQPQPEPQLVQANLPWKVCVWHQSKQDKVKPGCTDRWMLQLPSGWILPTSTSLLPVSLGKTCHHLCVIWVGLSVPGLCCLHGHTAKYRAQTTPWWQGLRGEARGSKHELPGKTSAGSAWGGSMHACMGIVKEESMWL